MILLGILLLIIYVFVRHPLLWIGGGILIGLGLLFVILDAAGHPVLNSPYGW